MWSMPAGFVTVLGVFRLASLSRRCRMGLERLGFGLECKVAGEKER